MAINISSSKGRGILTGTMFSTIDMEEGIYGKRDLMQQEIPESAVWSEISPNVYELAQETVGKLAPGVYSITINNQSGHALFLKQNLITDDIINSGDDIADTVSKEINTFWDKTDIFKKYHVLQRRGYMFYGRQGTGKTSIINRICIEAIRRGGIILQCGNPKFLSLALSEFRIAEKDRPVVCVFEDIDAIVSKYGEDDLLAVLDGANQINRVLNIASTNYPERLDKRIVSRPRRFDRVIKIEAPGKEMREAYFNSKLPKGEVKKWLELTEGLSFAALAEAIVSVKCLGNTLEKTVEILKTIESRQVSSDDSGEDFGFITNTSNTSNSKK